MDIVVCVKTNPDLQMVRIKNREAVTEAVPYKIGDLEKNALQAAVDLRTAVGGKVVALCLAEGNRKAAEDIKVALAMGADEAVVIDDPALAAPDQAAVAAALAAAVKKLDACDLLLFGEGSTDNYTGQVGPRVAELLGLPQIGYARKVEAPRTAPSAASAAWTTCSRRSRRRCRRSSPWSARSTSRRSPASCRS